MSTLTIHHYLFLSAALFAIGLYGVAARKHAIAVLMGIELMLNAANINFVAFARYVTPEQPLGWIFSVFVITIVAAEAAVGLALVVSICRNFDKVNFDEIKLMRW